MSGAENKKVRSQTYVQMSAEEGLHSTFLSFLFIPEMLVPFLMVGVSLLPTSSLLYHTGMFVPVAKRLVFQLSFALAQLQFMCFVIYKLRM